MFQVGKDDLDEQDLAGQLESLWSVVPPLQHDKDCLVDLAELDECVVWFPQEDRERLRLLTWREALSPVTRYIVQVQAEIC